jgi:hypothetical protein
MFQLPTQLWTIVLRRANVWAAILMKQVDDDTNREISTDESKDHGEASFSSKIKGYNLDIWHEVLYLGQVRPHKRIYTTTVPLRRHSAMLILSMPPLHFEICNIQPGP